MNQSACIKVSIQNNDFDCQFEKNYLKKCANNIGAIIEFTGCVRAEVQLERSLKAIFLEHYSPMTENVIGHIVEQACLRWNIIAITVIHRVGVLNIGENIVYIGVAAQHRKSALECVDFIMDFLKNDVPIWKKEISQETEQWIIQKLSDNNAKKSWL